MIPCNNCICVAICRHKPYGQLFKDCKLLVAHLNDSTIGAENMNNFVKLINLFDCSMRSLIQDELNPSNWNVDVHGEFIKIDGLMTSYGLEVICPED